MINEKNSGGQEIGTWTPSVYAGDFTTLTLSNGKYIKFGKFMLAFFEWKATASASSGSKYLIVEGLPYSFISSGAYGNTYNFSLGTIAPSRAVYARMNAYFVGVTTGDSGVCWVCGILA